MQNRDAPAFQEYAASMMAKLPYRKMTLSERGLLYTMRLECWENQRLPLSPELLAKVLGFAEADIRQALPAVMPFFAKHEGHIVCPELDDYRQHLNDQRAKQSAGGRQGAEKTNARRGSTKADKSPIPPIPSGNPQLPRRGEVGSLVQQSPEQQSQNQSLMNGVVDDWIADYNRAQRTEQANDYSKASRG